ncbi:MAG: ShlB/FhaC/HecB family hemolysin secretion/activation protein [Rickettsiales bacterium]|nr:ShlB/FhaC/HecB family hemolysin secretion/activation protein [Rickettsiales bacterium]
MDMKHNYIYGLIAILAFFPSVVVAQAAYTPAVDPGIIQQRFKIQQAPTVDPNSAIITTDEGAGNKTLKGDLTFVFKEIKFVDLTAFSEDDLKPIYASYVGQEISLTTLNQIVSKITAYYRNNGYILSRAILPPQKIDHGVVTVRIIEGAVDQVQFQGLAVNDGILRDYADRIRESKPLNAETLERYLLLMEDLPGLSARAVIRPSPTVTGASDVIITLSEKQFDGQIMADNRGSRYIGPYQTSLTLGANNVLGVYDRTQIRGIVTPFQTEELKYGQIQHQEMLGSDGTMLSLSASTTTTNPGSRLSNLDIHGEDSTYSVEVSHPILRSRKDNLVGALGFDVKNVDVELANSDFYQDRLRVARASFMYDFVDSMLAINRVEFSGSKGVGIDDNTDLNIRSRAVGNTSFLKTNLQVSRLQPVFDYFNLYLSAAGQLSADPLLSAEQFGVGGPNFASAYDPSELTGDSGWSGRAELQYSQAPKWDLLKSYQFYGFLDYGKAWKRHALPGEIESDSLSSTGMGTRLVLPDELFVNVELALPISKKVAIAGEDGDEPRLFFNLSRNF